MRLFFLYGLLTTAKAQMSNVMSELVSYYPTTILEFTLYLLIIPHSTQTALKFI